MEVGFFNVLTPEDGRVYIGIFFNIKLLSFLDQHMAMRLFSLLFIAGIESAFYTDNTGLQV